MTTFTELHQVEINETCIKVASACTTYVSAIALDEELLELENNYRQTLKQIRAAGAKISYKRKLKQQILDLKAPVASQFELYHEIYRALKDGWKIKAAKGIPYGCLGDDEINRLFEKANTLNSMLWNSTPLGKALSINTELKDLKARFARCHDASGDVKAFL